MLKYCDPWPTLLWLSLKYVFIYRMSTSMLSIKIQVNKIRIIMIVEKIIKQIILVQNKEILIFI